MPRAWRPADTGALVAIAVLAGVIRLIGIGTPPQLVFDEGFYAADACWYLHPSQEECKIRGETSRVHPPLAKWIMAAGIRLFGYTPVGWRIASWATGTLSIALLYLLARRLLRSTAGAAIAAGLMAVDFLHFVHSRTAMLDIFMMTFGLAAFLFAVYDRDTPPRGLWRPWRIAAGVAAGASIASKWPGLYVLAGVIGLTLWWEIQRVPGRRRIGHIVRSLPAIVLPLLLVPAVIYALSYIGRIEGQVFAVPWERGSWWRAFAGRQWHMLRFHTTRDFAPNPWQSPAWSWLLLRRPPVYFFKESGLGVQEVLGLGSPLVWWLAIPAIAAAAASWFRRRGDAEAAILTGFAMTYLPWLFFDRVRSFVFLFYLLPAIPFLCLAVARVGTAALAWKWGRVAVVAYAVGVVALLAFYYPVLAARPISYEAWMTRVGLFTDCGHPGTTGGMILEGTRLLPALRLGPPPPGWCWI